MDSFGILYSVRNANHTVDPSPVEVTVELHMNYLKTVKHSLNRFRKGYNRCLDIGIMVMPPVKEIEAIYIYFPFQIKIEDVMDLGNAIKDPSLFCTLFNDDFSITNVVEHPLFSEVRPKSDNRQGFWLYTLGKNTYSLQDGIKKGSLLKIEIKELPSEDNFVKINEEKEIKKQKGPGLYFRLRINNIRKSDFYFEEKVTNDIFQSAFSKAEMLDLRVNEIREFDKNVIDDLKKNRFFVTFTKFHFFFIGSSENEQVLGDTNYSDCRLLDSEKWGSYSEDLNNKDKKYLAYHWCKKAKDNECFPTCKVFLRTIYSSINIKKAIEYCLIVIFLGFLGSALCSLLQSLVAI